MKILHVESGRHFYGGPQQVAYLLKGLAARGVSNGLVCAPGSEIGRAARACGATVYEVACGGDLDLSFAWWLSRIARWERPDLLHCHSRRGADVLGGLAAGWARVPAVVSRRVDHTEPAFLAALRYRGFRRVIAISDNVAGSLRDSGIAEPKLTVIRSAVDFARFQKPPDREKLRREFALAPDAVAIAAAGQLIPRKGHRYLLEAMARLSPARPELVLAIFGQGALEAELKAQAETLKLGGAVRFAGFREDLDDYLGAFDLLVHPALREGLGVATLKAAAAGVPVVAFDVAGSREAVLDGRTGLLVPAKDPRALESGIARLLDDGRLRHALGAAARQRMREEFSIEALVDRHVRLYDTVLRDSSARRS